ncbi:MAG TPA: AraC family transcriptional regulator [Agriterribacter sp.]|nr:AraC family transcriptional regulator [Agriterribacter sp.]
MKPIAARIIEGIGEGHFFTVKAINLPYFSTEFHFHDACQLVYVVESEGKRIIGDSVEHFHSDELIFLGASVPHVWHNDQHYFKTSDTVHARSVALFFNPDDLLNRLAGLCDVKRLEVMLRQAQRGMQFFGESKKQMTALLLEMLHQKELPSVINLLRLLQLICDTQDFVYLASGGYVNNYHSKDNKRMDLVFKHVFENFREEIPLSKVAGIANMNIQAFCRYFKTRTQKPFTHFVNEVRIGHACKLLSNGEENITAISLESGFNSVSNFNRFFKTIKGITPREFRKNLQV